MAQTFTPRANVSTTAAVSAQERLWQALGTAQVTTCKIVCNGDSNTWGHYPPSADLHAIVRWTTRLGRLLQQRYNMPGTRGDYYMAMDLGWIDGSGNAWGSSPFTGRGLGFQSRSLDAGAIMQRTFADTDRFTLLYEGGGGAFTVTIDGGTPITITPTATAQDHSNSNQWVSDPLTRGSHTVVITAGSSACVISGLYAHGGDYSAGVQLYTAGKNGSTSTDAMNTTNFQRIKAISPKIVFVQLLSNNFSVQGDPNKYQRDMSNYIERILNDCPNAVIVLFNSHYRKYTSGTPTYTQQLYIAKLQELAAARPQNVMLVNSSNLLPQFTNEYPASVASSLDVWSSHNGDGVHMNYPGHGMVANALAADICTPKIRSVGLPVPELVLPTPVLEYDASNLTLADGAAVSSWPSTGSDITPLAVGSGTAPTMSAAAAPYGVVFGGGASLAAQFAAPVAAGTLVIAHRGTSGVTARQSLIAQLSGQSAYWQVDQTGSGLQASFGWTGTDQVTGASGYNALGAWNLTAVNFQANDLWLMLNKINRQSRRFTFASGGAVPGMTVGANAARSGNFLTGRIGYIGVFAPLTTVQVSEVLKKLASRYGITLTGDATTEIA